MIRRLFTIASVASLLLCAVAAGLWVRSYAVEDDIGHMKRWAVEPGEYGMWQFEDDVLSSGRGRLVLCRTSHAQQGPASSNRLRRSVWRWSHDEIPDFPDTRWQEHGLFVDSTGGEYRSGINRVTLRDGWAVVATPYWFVSSLLMILPFLKSL